MMTREIKFRAWDGKNMIMNPLAFNQTFKMDELMQFTGLKDKNGVEVYDGDIVEYPWTDLDKDYIHIGEVKWFKDRWAICVDKIQHCYDLGDRPLSLNVIGNIKENPELL